jgi:type IX secretion system PorP/SprF family membrane protein
MTNFFPKKWLALLLALLIIGTAGAQDIHFSQFAETPLYRNPALAGIYNGDVRVQMVYRTQWNSIANAYKTASLNAEYKMPVGKSDDFLTIGMMILHDRAGTASLTTTHIMPALNFHKSLSSEKNMYLSAGFMGGWVQRRIDRSKMTTNDQYDGMSGGDNFAESQYSYLDGSAGISFDYGFDHNPNDNLVLGVAYHHFNKPKNSFFNDANIVISPKLVFSADVKFDIGEASNITIQSDYSRQSSYQEIIGGIMYGLKLGPLTDKPDYVIHGGLFYRLNDAVIPTIKIDYRPLSFALSYDVNVSKLKTTSYGRGGFELSLTYIGFLNRNNTTLDAVRCPRF